MSYNSIDISDYQAGINIAHLGNELSAVIVKVTESTDYVSPSANNQIAQVIAANKKLGLYHFAGSSISKKIGDAIVEADYFLSHTTEWHHNAMVMLDWEPYGYGLSPTEETEWCYAWLNHVKGALGRVPVIYMDMNHVRIWNGSVPISAAKVGSISRLQIAGGQDYSTVQGFSNKLPMAGIPAYWHQFGWQYTSRGNINGYQPLDLNAEFDPDWMGIGSIHSAPVTTPKLPAPDTIVTHTNSYTVVPNDNLFDIGKRVGVPWQTIAEINHIQAPYVIKPGQVLRLVGQPTVSTNTGSKTYEVIPNDNLYSIAKKYPGVSWQQIAAANNISAPYIIKPGQRLLIP